MACQETPPPATDTDKDAGGLEQPGCAPWSQPQAPPAVLSCTGTAGAPQTRGPAEQLELLPGGVLVVRNVTYARRGGVDLQGDLFVPPTAPGTKPGILAVVHGGGWSACDRRRAAIGDYAYGMALLGGFATFNVEYRLVSEGGAFPENLLDVKCAVQWLGEKAPSRFGIDGSKVAISGESAGAQLALLVGLTEHRTDLDPQCGVAAARVRAVVAYSPPTDLADLARATDVAGSAAVAPNTDDCVDVQTPDCTASRACSRCADASPTAHACNARSPIITVQAPDPWDLLIPHAQAQKLHARLTDAGLPSTLLTPSPASLSDAGCAPVPNQFAHGFVPCLTQTTGAEVLSLLAPLLRP